MPEWLENLLAAVGGGTVVLVGVLTIFKGLLVKLFETGIESSFEKNLENYRNKLSRSTKAFEILLEKEFEYYSSLDPHLAMLVPLVQDLVYYSDMSNEMELSFRQSHYKEEILQYLKIIPDLKNNSVLYQPYIPERIFAEVSHLLGAMQQNLDFWSKAGNVVFKESEETIDIKKAKEISDSILLHIASGELAIKKRLTELSEQ